MVKAVLFDLDDTLLGNDMDTFIPQYFALLGQYAERYLPREAFLQALLACTQLMTLNVDPALTNRDVFWQGFAAQTGLDSVMLEAYFDAFYEDQFLALETIMTRRETAVPLIQACQSQNLQVVIATNPLFPRPAIEARLRWAGLPVTEFDFALVTTYENMHATKPQSAYYTEILARLGLTAAETLMVGNDWENDIVPAAALGCYTYWLPPDAASVPPEADMVRGFGSLADLYKLLTSGWLAELAA